MRYQWEFLIKGDGIDGFNLRFAGSHKGPETMGLGKLIFEHANRSGCKFNDFFERFRGF